MTNQRLYVDKNIYRVAWWNLLNYEQINCDVYAIDCGEEVVLIDSSRGGDSFYLMKENLIELSLFDRITTCLITHMHKDHAGGINNLRNDGIKVWASDEYNQYIINDKAKSYWNNDIPIVDKTIQPGETFTIGNVKFEAIKTKGHTSTCMTYIATVNCKRYAFTGDMVMPNGTIGYSGSFDFDSKLLIASLKCLLEYDFDAVLTGHYLEKTQPEGFWLVNGKQNVIKTFQNGIDGKWKIN